MDEDYTAALAEFDRENRPSTESHPLKRFCHIGRLGQWSQRSPLALSELTSLAPAKGHWSFLASISQLT